MQSDSAVSRLKTGSRKREQEIHTPTWIREMCREMLDLGELFDPCASSVSEQHFADHNWTNSDVEFEGDFAQRPINERNLIYVNPPFNDLPKWAGKCNVWGEEGLRVLMLCPARLHRRKLVDQLIGAHRIYALDYNVKFEGYSNTYPEPLLFACWNCRIPSAYLTRVTSIITIK